MPRKVIQVPVDERLLEDLDNVSRMRGKPRAAVIREACVRYLGEIEDEKLDRAYRQGYITIPEEPAIGEAQLAMVGEVVAEEAW